MIPADQCDHHFQGVRCQLSVGHGGNHKIGFLPTYETVNHPQHYNLHPSGIECIQVIQHMTFNVGTAIKHCWRAGLKPSQDHVEDLKKAIRYLEFEIERLEKK